jgi:hypothetical protein
MNTEVVPPDPLDWTALFNTSGFGAPAFVVFLSKDHLVFNKYVDLRKSQRIVLLSAAQISKLNELWFAAVKEPGASPDPRLADGMDVMIQWKTNDSVLKRSFKVSVWEPWNENAARLGKEIDRLAPAGFAR